jgi:HAD superfamily hydrolase (TIGR01509 family)
MDLHVEAWTRFTERHHLRPFTLEVRARLDGKRNRDIFPIIFERELSTDDIKRYADEKESLYREISRGRVEPLPGLDRLLAALERRGLPVSLATSSTPENIRHTLGEVGLQRLLPFVARSDEVARGKPYPDVFEAAARLIGVPPSECLAFEDAPAGMRAARAAGMTCVAITTTFPAADFAAHGVPPDAAFADFDEFLAGPGAWLLEAG